MLKGIDFLLKKSRGFKTSPLEGEVDTKCRVRGNNKLTGGTFYRWFTFPLNVILRRYSLPEVPRRRIHNVIADAMSICVAFSNKVMDTRLPLPVGSGDKYDVSGWCGVRWLGGYSASTLDVILRRYSLPEVPGRRIHNVIANAMSICVAFGNKVMDTPELPQPIKQHVAPKYDVCCVGRSMIEMLGVLAIIAVLSVGGIAGYSKAMEKYKINKAVSEYSYFIFNMFEHGDEFKKLPEGTGLAKLAEQLDFLPASWKYYAGGWGERWVIDGLHNEIQMWQTDGILIFEIYLLGGENSKKYALCRGLLKDFIYPLHDFARSAYVWKKQSETGTEVWYGKNYCNNHRYCLKDVTVAKMDEACRTCTNSSQGCSVVLTY